MKPPARFLALLVLVSGSGAYAQLEERTLLAVQGTSIIDVASGAVRSGQTVLIDRDRIVAVGTGEAISIPVDAIRIDGAGRFLMPGFWDMHVHTQDPEPYSLLYVANGVMGVRDMGGNDPDHQAAVSTSFEEIRRWRTRVDAGEVLGPRVIAARSIIDGPPGFWPGLAVIETEDQARSLVDEEAAEGADFIKVYSLLRAPVFHALADQARSRGLDLAGHLSELVGIDEALRAGQRTIEHFTEGRYLVVTSSREADLVQRYRETWLPAAMDDPGEASDVWRNWLSVLDEAAASPDAEKAEALVGLLAASDAWQVPTWRVLRLEHFQSIPDDARDEYVPTAIREMWDAHPLRSGLFEDSALSELGATVLEANRRLLARMRSGRVRFLAGSDSGNPGLVPGFALHDELADLVEDAGFTPVEALQMATLDPARYLGQLDRLGTVEVGKVADLVLLRANPLEDIRNTRSIEAVITRGNYLDRATLEEMLASVRRTYAR